MDNKKIGAFLRDLRKEHNLTQEELGEKLGATNKTISRWETGTYMPPVDILLQLSKLYDVSVNEILSGERLATADYQPKAEENIVTSLRDTSAVKKRVKTTVIVIVAVILSAIVALAPLSILWVGYILMGGRQVYTSGDFTYKTYGDKNDKRAEITGLSDEGMTKEVIIIPETIDGLRVSYIRDRVMFGDFTFQNFNSKMLKKVYFSSTEIGCDQNTFSDCNNLTQIVMIKCFEESYLNYFWASENSDKGRYITVYLYKDFYDIVSQSWQEHVFEENRYAKANVTYYYNYFGAPNGDCYWLDQVEVGQPISFVPPEPTRESDKYKFDGWFTEKECINRYFVYDSVLPESGELELYAKWIYNS